MDKRINIPYFLSSNNSNDNSILNKSIYTLCNICESQTQMCGECSGCQNTSICQSTCQKSCQGCETGCEVSCQECVNCQSLCEICENCLDCQNACQNSCQSCNTTCQSCNTCQDTCQNSCQSCNTAQHSHDYTNKITYETNIDNNTHTRKEYCSCGSYRTTSNLPHEWDEEWFWAEGMVLKQCTLCLAVAKISDKPNFSWKVPKVKGEPYQVTAEETNDYITLLNQKLKSKKKKFRSKYIAILGEKLSSSDFTRFREGLMEIGVPISDLPPIILTDTKVSADYLNKLATCLNSVQISLVDIV